MSNEPIEFNRLAKCRKEESHLTADYRFIFSDQHLLIADERDGVVFLSGYDFRFRSDVPNGFSVYGWFMTTANP